MKSKILSVLPVVGIMALAMQARGDVVDFSFSGSGVSGSGTITYSPQAGGVDTISDVSGVFSDANAGLNIVNATIGNIVAINPVVPLPAAVTAPDFSQYAVANGVPSTPPSASLSYDNNFYPGGSPSVCTDYPFFGGVLDVYGMMFTISNGDVVDMWSNGIMPGPADPAIYGVAVADANNTYDYVSGGVTLVAPEPASFALMAVAVGGLGLARRRKAAVA